MDTVGLALSTLRLIFLCIIFLSVFNVFVPIFVWYPFSNICMNQTVRFLPDKFIEKKKIRMFFSLEGHWKFVGKGLKGHSLLTTMHACAQMFPPKSFHSHHRFRTFYELLLHVHPAFFIILLFVGAQFLVYFNILFLVFELQMFKELYTFLCQLPIHFSLLRMVSLQ